MNEARLKELKKILNERHQNVEQSSGNSFNLESLKYPIQINGIWN